MRCDTPLVRTLVQALLPQGAVLSKTQCALRSGVEVECIQHLAQFPVCHPVPTTTTMVMMTERVPECYCNIINIVIIMSTLSWNGAVCWRKFTRHAEVQRLEWIWVKRTGVQLKVVNSVGKMMEYSASRLRHTFLVTKHVLRNGYDTFRMCTELSQLFPFCKPSNECTFRDGSIWKRLLFISTLALIVQMATKTKCMDPSSSSLSPSSSASVCGHV